MDSSGKGLRLQVTEASLRAQRGQALAPWAGTHLGDCFTPSPRLSLLVTEAEKGSNTMSLADSRVGQGTLSPQLGPALRPGLRRPARLTRLMSCSPVSEAVMSLQRAWRAGLGRPTPRRRRVSPRGARTPTALLLPQAKSLRHSVSVACGSLT